MSPPVPVVFALAQISFAREPRVHAATRPSLRPLYSMRVIDGKTSGDMRRENMDSCFTTVIEATGPREAWPDDSTARCGLRQGIQHSRGTSAKAPASLEYPIARRTLPSGGGRDSGAHDRAAPTGA